ncbi:MULTISPECIES: methylmalonyl Co-A mutase-associated GTPase MeaB [Nocardiopsis]|uniref:Methylmalonyl Co-A mutase-associated GTPase MeaB n=2 Tax=Nocardiopsis alba TaxID=53437 RepID=A0A7K2IVG0_9ACTN|nr:MULTISPECIES: methylmalonyl Co-A mutase-associated GTPase MeaB [Nocardiopsis]AFR07087.1 LAO/AO transport system ATPase [Nocardiopsis alba ATCC BAA-2165]MEC3894915.1 methylmalonyl Co-A mutase-associated GTPase MeaB [Nocardiopsis sp. LDBS1602]MYR33960.1 methylmalonyl Co-A mutase-associated GTPase MeaB [Nocardiopsis alba]
MNAPELVERVHGGDRRALARAITLVENGAEELRPIMAGLAPHTGRARVVGFTGSPGVGKSTTTNAVVRAVRAQGRTVAVLAVDPSSPFTGGALLGDRVRMQEHATDPGVYIRSMANRGHLGGLSWATPHALRVLDAAGFDVILVETVGVGQAEVDIAGQADTTVVLCAPGMGDSVQAAKAGVLEVADVFAINKADRDGARVTLRELRQMIAMKDRTDEEWKPPIVMTVAAEDKGVDELWERIDGHFAHLESSGELAARRSARARDEVQAIVLDLLRSRLGGVETDGGLDSLAREVASGERDPYGAADLLLKELGATSGL